MTREQWLNKLVSKLRPYFVKKTGQVIPKRVRVSCGWPSIRGTACKNRRLAECWSDGNSSDDHYEIFISPVESDSIEVSDHLVHELVHTVVGTEHGHKAPFRKIALAIGLEGEMCSSTAGPELREHLQQLVEKIGSYPHASVTPNVKRNKQSTRLLKCECPECGYVVRVTQKWIDVGLPTCPCGTEIKVA